MSSEKAAKKELLLQFTILIKKAEWVWGSRRTIDRPPRETWGGQQIGGGHTSEVVPYLEFVELITNSASLLDRVIPPGSAHADLPKGIRILECNPQSAQFVLATLNAIRADFDGGMFEHLSVMVEAEATADYLGQANMLMQEGTTGNFDHIPAAVLAGAVLERALRVLCGRQLETRTQKGTSKT
ncbi:MAG: hypothetical protein ACREP2_13325, partial [Rhodanobacteraceae bacterium]